MYHLPYFLVQTTLLCIHLSFANIHQDAHQVVMQSPEDGKPNSESAASNTPKVAIIGAGITGASSAHHLHQLTRLNQPLDITVFDSEDQVGGRIRSAHVHDEPGYDVESGAAAFTEDDWCMKEAMREVGLKPVQHSRPDYHTGVWDGNEFLVRYDNSDKPLSGTWWQLPNWLWRYGSSLSKIQEMIKRSAERFSSFAVFHPFLKLSERLGESFSLQEVSLSASSCFENNGASAKLINEIVRAETRNRHARDLHQVNVLSSTLALRSAPDVSIYQGNQRLPHRMMKISEAYIRLNTRVSRITAGEKRRWRVHARTSNVAETEASTSTADFDIIVLTAPFAFNGIDIDPPLSTLASKTESDRIWKDTLPFSPPSTAFLPTTSIDRSTPPSQKPSSRLQGSPFQKAATKSSASQSPTASLPPTPATTWTSSSTSTKSSPPNRPQTTKSHVFLAITWNPVIRRGRFASRYRSLASHGSIAKLGNMHTLDLALAVPSSMISKWRPICITRLLPRKCSARWRWAAGWA